MAKKTIYQAMEVQPMPTPSLTGNKKQNTLATAQTATPQVSSKSGMDADRASQLYSANRRNAMINTGAPTLAGQVARQYKLLSNQNNGYGSGVPTGNGQTLNDSNGNVNTKGTSGGGLSSQLQSLYQQQLAAQQNTANNLAAQLKTQQEQYQSQLRAQQEAQAQAAQNAYSANMAALQQAYQKKLSGLNSNLASTKDLLASAYQNSQKNLNTSAEKALQEAYINRMMNERSLAQQLNAQGLNGGASESAIASMLNNYGTSRNNINTALDGSLRELEQNYNSNLASALQNYNDAVGSVEDTNLSYKMQLENALANNILGSYQNLYNAFGNLDSNYASAMTNLINNQASANTELQQQLYNTLAKNVGTSSTATVSGSTSGISQDVTNKVKQLYQSGYTAQQLMDQLSEYSDEQIAQIFVEAGISL